MSAPTPKSGIMQIEPYVGGESGVEGALRVIKLSSNEGAFGPSPKAAAAYSDIAKSIHLYPDGGSHELRTAIGETYELDPERIVCGAGSDELISLICQSYAGPGDEVLYSEHGFLMYQISAKSVGATPVTAPERKLTADVDALLAGVTEKTRILFLANPNNPTGTYLPASEVKRLRDSLRDDVLLVIDAAYAEFVTREDYSEGNELVDARDNVIVTRTFSKMHGLGGMRLGWCYGPPAVIDVLNRVRGPFNVGAAAQASGAVAVRDLAFQAKVRDHNLKWLAWTREQLIDLGLDVTDSVGNFILACFKSHPDRTADAAELALKKEGIIVRKMGGYGLPDCLRITIGLEEDMRAVVDVLRQFMGKNE